MKTIKNMPEQFINTVDEVVGGLTKVFQSKPGKIPEASKVGAAIEEVSFRVDYKQLAYFHLRKTIINFEFDTFYIKGIKKS